VLGLALIAFNRQIGVAMQKGNRAVYGEGAFEATIVYRTIIGIFGAFLAYTALKDWWISN
jgi:hypothetical protein